MLVARHWAHARLQEKRDGRQVTVRRWGWSDASLADAQAMAESRCRDALEDAFRGRELDRREGLRDYHGKEGRPIREELLERLDEDTVITRNSYGAACLNVRDVVFADMDLPPLPRADRFGRTLLVPLMTAFVFRWLGFDWGATIGLSLLAWLLLGLAYLGFHARFIRPQKMAERDAAARAGLDARLAAAMKSRPDWLVDVYRTPNGYRLLLRSHRLAPDSVEVARWFDELGADPAYAHLCRLQRCYRARLTAKPWRAGVNLNLPKRAMRWPTPPDCVARRRDWVDRYERAATERAACRYERTLGRGKADPRCERVKRVHDERTRALSSSLRLA